MIIAVTGMVGLDKKAYLENVVDLCKQKGRDVELFNVGDMMYAEAPDIAQTRILDIPLKRLHNLRRSVFKDIIAKSKDHAHSIVNTHATFRWRHGLFPAIDFDQMRALGVDMWVCMIDGVDALHLRLIEEHPIRHSLKDLIVWREEEMLGTEMLRNGIDPNIPFYCVARGVEQETTDSFYKLMFEPDAKKVYLSFPMTHVIGMPEVKTRIEQFRDTMKSHFICFDPGDLEEMYLPIYAEKARKENSPTVQMEKDGKQFLLDTEELFQIESDIKGQVYARDFLLIDQSDMIISFIPAIADGTPAISSGVERELQHAYEGAKEVYVIWTSEKEPSVFITQTATKVFKDETEAIEFFTKKKYIKN